MSEQGQFLLYTAPDGEVKVDVFFKEVTAWLTQKALQMLRSRSSRRESAHSQCSRRKAGLSLVTSAATKSETV